MLVLSDSKKLSTQFGMTDFYLKLTSVAVFFFFFFNLIKSLYSNYSCSIKIERGTPRLYFEPVTVQTLYK